MRYFIFILLYTRALTTFADGSASRENVLSCEYSNTDWEPLGEQLFTCDIFEQAVASADYKIKYEPLESEKVEGLRFNDNKGLKYLPENIAELFPNIKGITARGTYLSSLSSSDLKGLSKLKYITFANSDLGTIEDYTFKDLTELQELDLSDSNIQSIGENGFHGLKSLKTLYLGGNKLSYLEPKIFEGLTALESLSLELNHIEYIDENLFATNENLADIWLNKNKIIGLQFKVFENLPKFSYVDLQENPCVDGVYDESNIDELKEILNENCTAVAPVRKLQTVEKVSIEMTESNTDGDVPKEEYSIDGDIDTGLFAVHTKFIKSPDEDDDGSISSNLVECEEADQSIETCVVLNQAINSKDFVFSTTETEGSNIKTMSFANNVKIKYLPSNIGKFAPNLEQFTAKNASLKIISKKNFAGLKHLKSLNLADNRIKFIDPDAFDDLISLEELDLSGNELGDLDEEIFRKLKNLKTLRIGRNQMHSIHPNLLKNLRNLVNVSISHQQISDLNENIFKQNTKLQNVWMNSNKIKTLSPNMFTKHKHLEYVDIRDNKCMDNFFTPKTLQSLKTDVQEKCGKGYKLKMGVKIDDAKKTDHDKPKKDKKKKKQKLPKQRVNDEEKEVICDYEDIFWPHLNKTVTTCVINEPIDDPHYLISANPMSPENFVNGESIQAISFKNNKNVKFLPKNLLDVFPNLIAFSSANAALTSIDPENFKGLKHLTELDLSGNKLSHIDRDTFKDLNSLEVLNLNDNDIEEFEDETFSYTTKLKKLRMKGNKLKTIHASWFEDMSDLEEISFNLSSSVELQRNMFEHNHKLKIIEWNGVQYDAKLNQLDGSDAKDEIDTEISCVYTEVKDESTGEMIQVCELSDFLSHSSKSYSIKASPKNNRVKRFIVSNPDKSGLNLNVKELPKNLGESFPFLEEIVVENTGLEDISKDHFQNLPYLKKLKLNNNMISTIVADTFENLPQLEELDLSGNSLQQLPNGVFYSIKNLKLLDLNDNKLDSIEPHSFKFLEDLETISISNNKLQSLDRHLFKNNLNLKKIDLSGNAIEEMSPKMFDKLTRLERISVLGNKCIDGDFDGVTYLDQLRKDIKKDCKNPSQEKEISCELKDASGDVCIVNENVVIDEPGYEVTIDANLMDPTIVKSFVIQNNEDVKYLPENIGEIFPNLERLKVSGTLIEDLPRDTFKDMKNVKDVDLSKNKIKVLYGNSFSGLDSANKINLSGNKIEEIYGFPFLNVPKLKIIDITKNSMSIPDNIFNGLPELQTTLVDGGNNDEPEVDIKKEVSCNDFDFDELDGTLTCTISNQLIDSDDFSLKMPSLDGVTTFKLIGDRDIKHLPNNIHKIYPNVKSLEVHGTNIEDIPNNIYEFSNLEFLDLSRNQIKAIRSNSFHDLPNLKRLSLENNSIDDIDELSFDLPHLEWLNLGSNKIKSLPNKIFSRVPKLTMVSFDNNDNLSDIDESIFEPVNNESVRYSITKNGRRISKLRKVVVVDGDSEEVSYDYEIEIFHRTTKKQKVKVIQEYEVGEDEDSLSTPEYQITREVSCEFVKSDFDESQFTCLIHGQPISSNNSRIKTSPINQKVNMIKIENDKDVKYIPENIGDDFPNVEVLTVKNTSLSEIPGTVIKKLTKLKVLELPDNEIKELDPDVFKNLTEIESFDFSGNKIEEIPVEVFENNLQLKKLDLADNNLTELDPKMFNYLPNLKEISITGNNIPDEVTEILIKKISSTTESSSESKIVECQGEYIPSLSACVIENIDTTNLKSIKSPDSLIKTLKIENSPKLTSLPDNIAEIFPDIQELIIKNTSIKEIPFDALNDLKNLKVLDLSNNEMEELDPKLLNEKPMLEIINLSDNKIKELPDNFFENLPELKLINLDNNEISEIDPKIFESLPKLTDLSVNGNDLPDDLIEEIAEKYPQVEVSSPIISTTEMSQVIKDLECELGYTEWKSIDPVSGVLESILTCTIMDQPILNENMKIKSTPYNPLVKGLRIDDNKNVKFIPGNIQKVFPNLQKLSIQNTSISSVPNKILDNLPHLNTLDVSNNEIKELNDSRLFETTPSLQEIDLSGNNLIEIPGDLFRFTEVKILNLSDNKISDLHPMFISDLPHLKKISLKGNNLPKDLIEKLIRDNPSLEIEKDAENDEEPIIKIEHSSPRTTTRKSSQTSSAGPSKGPKRTTTRLPNASTKPSISRGTTRKSIRKLTTTTPKSAIKAVKCELINSKSSTERKATLICEINEEEIADPEVSLMEIPDGDNVKVLKFDNNKNIKYFPDNIAHVLPNLKEITAVNSSIDSILPGDFEDLKELENIVLSGNEIKVIEPETFDGLKNLKNLDLSNNDIDFIDEDAFGNLPSLSTLNLDNNDLTFIHPKTFQHLPKLETISIEGNEITSLPEDIFTSNPKLKEVKHSIRNFILSTTTQRPFEPQIKVTTTTTVITTNTERNFELHDKSTARTQPKTPRLKEVECEYENIYWIFSGDEFYSCDFKNATIDDPSYVIKPSPKNKRVKGLSFVGSKNVKFLPQNIDKAFPNLVEISAYDTSIKEIPNYVFKNLPKLKSLNLMNSDINTIDPEALDDLWSLENLDLSDNHIRDLKPGTFKNLPSLKYIYANNNDLKNLDPTIFENLPELRNVSLEGNDLSEIDKNLFARNFELQNVWLNNNSISTIDPTVFDGKRSLEYVDLRNNDCIDSIFEGYALEGIRNELKSKCNNIQEKTQQKSETSTEPTFNYRTTTGRSFYIPATQKLPHSVTNFVERATTRKPLDPKGSRYTTYSPFDYGTKSTARHRGPQSFLGFDAVPLKEVKCSLNYHEFPGTRPEIYTCFVNDQAIDDPEFKIQSTPYNEYVTGVAIDDNKNVKFLPKNIDDIFPNLEHLSAKQNSITKIPNLNSLSRIKTLDFSDNGLSDLDPEMFKNLTSLEDLNLSGNQIPNISTSTLANMPVLKSLDLSRNNIEELPSDLFNNLPELRKVTLDSNRITELPEKLFSNNPKLEVINLNGNAITTIHPQAFTNLPNLGEINLEENYCISGSFKSGTLYALDSYIKRNCAPNDSTVTSDKEGDGGKLTSISTTEKSKEINEIECDYGDTFSSSTSDYLPSCIVNENKKVQDSDWMIKAQPENKRVKRFMIYDNNNIKKLPVNLGESFPNLTDIIVTDAPIKSISPLDFEDLSNLKSVTITGSSIKVLDPETFKGAPQLENLDLSGNNIRYVDDKALSGIKKLRNLDLSGNKIPKLSKDVLAHLPELKTLKLTGNDLENIDSDLFKANPQLYKVSMDENNLKSIDPDAFDKLPHLIDVDLRKNDCIDRSFGTSNMHMLRQIVNEHCQPFELVKSELKTCRKQILKCNSIPKDNGLRQSDALLKANAKIKQLNMQMNKLRNALNAEKESRKKEAEKMSHLESQLTEMMKSCARLDDNHNMLIDLNCDYNEPTNEQYSCNARKLKIKVENATIENAVGSHRRGKRNSDVNSLIISNQDVSYLPNGIAEHFPHLTELTIENSGLKKINHVPLSNLPHLNKLIIRGNDVHHIEPNAFIDIPQLEHLDLSQNNLMDMPIKILDTLPKLRFLNLNDNALLSLPQSIVPTVNNMKTFLVGDNNLNFIDPRLFKRLSGADIIDFTRNGCIDKSFNRLDDDYMSFIGEVSLKCINEDDNGFCKGRS